MMGVEQEPLMRRYHAKSYNTGAKRQALGERTNQMQQGFSPIAKQKRETAKPAPFGRHPAHDHNDNTKMHLMPNSIVELKKVKAVPAETIVNEVSCSSPSIAEFDPRSPSQIRSPQLDIAEGARLREIRHIRTQQIVPPETTHKQESFQCTARQTCIIA